MAQCGVHGFEYDATVPLLVPESLCNDNTSVLLCKISRTTWASEPTGYSSHFDYTEMLNVQLKANLPTPYLMSNRLTEAQKSRSNYQAGSNYTSIHL